VSCHRFILFVDGFEPERAVQSEIAELRIEHGSERRPTVSVALVERHQRIEVRSEPQAHALVASGGICDEKKAAEQIVRPMQKSDLIEQPAMADEHRCTSCDWRPCTDRLQKLRRRHAPEHARLDIGRRDSGRFSSNDPCDSALRCW